MPKMKSRKVVVAFTVTLHEENAESKLKALKARAQGEAQYIAEALGEDPSQKVKVTVEEA
jgi:hypothetical protein